MCNRQHTCSRATARGNQENPHRTPTKSPTHKRAGGVAYRLKTWYPPLPPDHRHFMPQPTQGSGQGARGGVWPPSVNPQVRQLKRWMRRYDVEMWEPMKDYMDTKADVCSVTGRGELERALLKAQRDYAARVAQSRGSEALMG